jgi:hypothetical protein
VIEHEITRLIESRNTGIPLTQSQILALGASGKAVIQKTIYKTNAVVIEHDCGSIELQIPLNEGLSKDIEGLHEIKFLDNTSSEFISSKSYTIDTDKYFAIIFALKEGGCRVQVSQKATS